MASATPICIVMTSFEPGGIGRQLIELARRFDQRGALHIACFHARGAWFARVAEVIAVIVAAIVSISLTGPARRRAIGTAQPRLAAS
jgi:uncharacterized membrane protein